MLLNNFEIIYNHEAVAREIEKIKENIVNENLIKNKNRKFKRILSVILFVFGSVMATFDGIFLFLGLALVIYAAVIPDFGKKPKEEISCDDIKRASSLSTCAIDYHMEIGEKKVLNIDVWKPPAIRKELIFYVTNKEGLVELKSIRLFDENKDGIDKFIVDVNKGCLFIPPAVLKNDSTWTEEYRKEADWRNLFKTEGQPFEFAFDLFQGIDSENENCEDHIKNLIDDIMAVNHWSEPFWKETAKLFMEAIFYTVCGCFPKEKQSLYMVLKYLTWLEVAATKVCDDEWYDRYDAEFFEGEIHEPNENLWKLACDSYKDFLGKINSMAIPTVSDIVYDSLIKYAVEYGED